ncbi:Inner membrane protein YgaP [Ephemeroptericola cinctiostellae]|uniref:Inner membrane protein YgaP n=1 Tax=Ephemeroptericola cinctiostellae TaxID=2268024 RepID=A0A345DA00_9BURK|nr:rhodanese-like domain-containing protein [Ephemeroptericola cinctiostellae]AXF85188.1 Inner membrane protein YgaP [Ephemeroptericola cinctiostellae]
MDFFLQPMNLALAAIAAISGGALLWPALTGSRASRITVTEATMLINKRAQIIDVRSAEAYAAGHIQNAKSLPLSNLNEQLPLLKLKKDKSVLVVCDRGVSAVKAAVLLTKAEYADVHVIEGGLNAWKDAQLPIVKS